MVGMDSCLRRNDGEGWFAVAESLGQGWFLDNS